MSSKQTFRSTIDYSENIGVDGCCCVPDSKSGGATRTTYSSCVELGGFFTPIPQDADHLSVQIYHKLVVAVHVHL